MRATLGRAVGALILAAGFVVATPAPPAEAGPVCSFWSWYCGAVTNASNSDTWIVTGEDWPWSGLPGGPGQYITNKVRLYPGQHSDFSVDTDGVYIRSGCYAWIDGQYTPGGQWTKVHDAVGSHLATVIC